MNAKMSRSSALALVAALAFAAPAAAGPMRRSVPLERAASFVATKPVQVECAPLGENAGLTVPGSSLVTLDSVYCVELERWLRGKPVSLMRLAIDIDTLVHESIHARGEVDEGKTDCEAYHRAPAIAARFFGIRAYVHQVQLVRNLNAARASFDEAYRTIC